MSNDTDIKLSSINHQIFNKSCLFIYFSKDNQDYTSLYKMCNTLVYVPVIDIKYESMLNYDAKVSICFMRFTNQFPSTYRPLEFKQEKYEVNFDKFNEHVKLLQNSKEKNVDVFESGIECIDECNYSKMFDSLD